MEQEYPLTKQQEGLWVEWRLHPDNTSYNTCVKLRLNGELDKPRFERALRDVVDFFSSLRVYFSEKGGLPFQNIKQDGAFTLEYEDVSVEGQAEESTQQQSRAKEFLEEKLRTPVDLKTFPIIRAGLIKTAPDIHYFIGLVPHMISDGASAVLFLESTSIAYNKGYEGLIEAYGDKPKDWSDYFSEDISKTDPKKWEEAAAYWKNRMSGAQHLVDFTHGQQDHSNNTKTGKRVYFDLSQSLSQSLKDYSRSQRTTLFSTLVAAFSTLINRYYAQEDVLIGYPVNIRPPGYKHLFGFFVNIIPIRIDLSGDPTYEELVGRVSAARKDDKKFQTFPALDIVREIRKDISGFDGRVFNLSMAQTVSRLVNLRLEGIKSAPLEADYNDVNDDLSLSYELLEDGRIGLWIEYRDSLFEAEFIEQMINHMGSLIKQVAAEPQKKISQYTLLDEKEYDQYLKEWAMPDSNAGKPEAETIHSLIENCVRKNPKNTALVYNDQKITYAQMDARANQLARHLQDEGATAGDKIALCLRRGPEMIIALLAVMKAGCAYVPIPPCYPRSRLEFILNDAKCRIVITQNDLLEDFDGIEDVSCISVDERAEIIGALDTAPLDIPVDENNSAYVIYTSGSTGNPKGVLLNHGNVTPRLLWLQHEMQLNDTDVILQNTDYSFDVSVAEIFWPLTTGASLILARADKYKDPTYIIDLIQNHKVTTTCFVPSLLGSLLAVLKDQDISSLKRVLAAGEALPPNMVKSFYDKCAGDLYNVYGPTEGAIYAAFKKCPKDINTQSIPIGRPIGDTSLYILDQSNRPQPIGVAGELHIGGKGVAQGYLNLPEMTADRFVPDPFTNDDNARLYKTGDLARFLPNGDIDYLGRIDAQVKIRGFRIELAEIDSVLLSYNGISDAASIDYGKNNKRIVSYYVEGAAHAIDMQDLKLHISEKLPEYMVPAFYIPIKEIPRLASGKINRRALPSPESLVKKRAEYVAPQNETEQKLAGIWANILKVPADKIGIYDSFFDIGGDSLMAIQFVCEAEEHGIMFETDTLFTNTTIESLAKIATDVPKEKQTIEQTPVSGDYPLLPRQAKFFKDNFAKPNHWNRFFFFEIDHDVDIEKLQSAFDSVLMHHDNLRVSFKRDENGKWHQHCDANLPQTQYLYSHDISQYSAKEQDIKIAGLANEQHVAINLAAAPLMRVIHFKTGENSGKLAAVVHHLLIDMVASRIIFEDLLKTYEGLRHNIEFPLPPKTTSAKDWATHLAAQATAQDFNDELAYWASPKMQPSPNIPTDVQGGALGTEQTAKQQKIILSRDATANLLKDIPASYNINIQDFLLACLLQTTKAWTGDDNLLFNICGHGRDGGKKYNLSRTAAWVNTVYPIHLKHHEHFSAYEHMTDVKAQIAQVPKKNGNYNLLRYHAEHPDIIKYPTPQVFFNYVSQLDAIMPDGVSFQPVQEPSGIVSSAPENHLAYLLYMEAGVIEKRLHIHMTYSTEIFKEATIECISKMFEDNITGAIQELMSAAKSLKVAE